MKHVRLTIDDELHKALKIYAIDNSKTIPQVVTEAIEAFLSNKKGEDTK